ncbi:MAG: hypothetical protein ACRD3E_16280, partial [Terriglobales bacterium]
MSTPRPPDAERTPSAGPELRVGRWSVGPAIVLRVVLVATALVYERTIAYGVVYDDFQESVMNPWV